MILARTRLLARADAAGRVYAFDPSQPRDKDGKWTLIGSGEVKVGGHTRRSVHEKLQIQRDLHMELDRLSQNPRILDALDQLETVYVHTDIGHNEHPIGVFSPAGTLVKKSGERILIGDRINLYPYMRGNGGKLVAEPKGAPALFSDHMSQYSVRGVVRHEVGHLVHWKLPDGKNNAEWQRVYTQIANDPNRYPVGGRESFSTRGWSRVSGYANTNAQEAFAESFTYYAHPDYRSGRLPKEVEIFLDKHVGRQGLEKREYKLSKYIEVWFGEPSVGWVQADVEESGTEIRYFALKQHPLTFEHIGKMLDALESVSKAELSAELRRVRAALGERLKVARSPKEFKALPRRSELEAAVRALLDRAHAAGSEAIQDEVPKAYAEWDESKHPRHSAGDEHGGEFSSLLKEIERLWRERTPPKTIDEIDPGTRVQRGEMRVIAKRLGLSVEETSPVFQSQLLRLFDRLKMEFPEDKWGKDTAATRELRRRMRKGEYAVSSFTPRSAVGWLAQAAFWITDLLSDDLLSEAQRILVNGLKTGKPASVMMAELFEAFVPYLGSRVGEEVVTAHRLETIVRTNTTTAYNHGRLTEILGADVVRFVDGVRYSAILDERTTEVCRFLDGKVFRLPAAQEELELLLPPRHYNCRSLIVPIVVGSPINLEDVITVDEVARAKELSGTGFMQRGAFRHYGGVELAARAALLSAQMELNKFK